MKRIKQVLTIAMASLMMVSCASAPKEAKETPVSVEEVVKIVFSGPVEKETVSSKIPGAAVAVRESVKATATIKAIDAATRNITLLTKDGKTATFTASSEMKNFDKLAANDPVLMTYTEVVAMYIDAGAAKDVDAVAGVARTVDAPVGALFSGVKVTGTVTEVDAAKRVFKVELSDKSLRQITGSEGIDFSKIQVGDAVTLVVGKVFQVDASK